MRVIRTDASSGGTPRFSAPPPLFYGPDTGLLDRGYAGSCSAMLKVAQMLLLLVGFICVRSSQWTDHNAYSYFEFVCIYDLIMIFIFYIIYIFRAYRKLTCISWPLAEFLHYLIGTILLLIASIVGVAKSSNSAGLVAGAMLPCKSFATSKCAQLLREELRKTCKMEWCIEMILKSILTGPRVPSSGTFQLLLGLLFQQPVSFGLIFGSWETRRAAVKDPVGRKESIF